MKLVSVIVPVYNVEKYLRECVESILAQSYSNIEIILVDDGSKDNSSTICDEYASKYERVKVFHKQNGGLSDARNYGISKASGEFYSFIDSDDVIPGNYIEGLLNACLMHNTQIAQCGMMRFTGSLAQKNETRITIKCSSYATYLKKDVPSVYNDAACSKLFDSKLFEEVRFPVNEYFEDGKTIIKLWLMTDKQALVDGVYYYWRVTPNSITTNYDFTKLFEQVTVWENRIALLKELRGYEENILELTSRVTAMLLYQYYDAKRHDVSREKTDVIVYKLKEYYPLVKKNKYFRRKQRLLLSTYKLSKWLYYRLAKIWYRRRLA